MISKSVLTFFVKKFINMKFCSILVCLVLNVITCYSQEKEEFKPSGKVIVRSFFDYSQGFGEANKESGFDITRALLGYKYQLSPTLSGQVVIDGASGRTPANKLEVYLRNAFLTWNDQGFNVNLGLTGLLQFKLQEDYWEHRYVLKSFQDLNKMGHSVDLGVTAQYTFNRYISADISLTNGAGYKDISKSESKRYAAGLNLSPLKGLVFRVYGDIYNESESLRDKLPEGCESDNYKYRNQYNLSLFSGYKNELISLGAEFNKMFNKGFIDSKNCYGYSFYSSVNLSPKWNVYARYDIMNSNTPSGYIEKWNSLDGQLMIAGIEYQPIKQLKISPNLRNLNPDRTKSEQYLFINFEVNW